MNSIKKRLTYSYLLIIFITVFIFESFLILSIKKYYFDNISEILTKQAEVCGKFYEKYISDYNIYSNSQNLIESFSSTTNAQIQIIDKNFNVISDSIGDYKYKLKYPDIKNALSGNLGIYKGTLAHSNESIMAVAYPLKHENKILGAVRFTTSLTEVNNIIFKIIIISILAGVLIIILVALISIFISHTITTPIEIITKAANNMASGNLSIKIKKQYNDEIGKLSDTLNYMSEEILKNDKLKNEFISSISHELKTPLTSITGWAITLKRNEIQDKNQINRGLEIIEKESIRLTNLVDELLDFSKLSSGKIALRFEQINVNELLSYVINQISPRADNQEIEIISNLDNNISLLYADPNRLKQVFINILDNSLKFTPSRGKIKISSAIEDNTIKISIIDTGCGIFSKDLPKIKQKFYKSDIKSSGSGIGLAICDEIIDLHNGQLIIHSTLNKGTIVEILLPSNIS